MKTVHMILVALVMAFAMVSCATKGADMNVNVAGEWKVVSLNGNDVPETMNAPALNFDMDEQMYSGATGANLLNGSFTCENGNLTLGEAALTQMMADSISMVVEGQFLKAVSAVKTVSYDNGSLLLKDENGNILMVLSK